MALDIQIEHLGLVGAAPLLRDWSLRIEEGQIHTLMGPSGCGKSSVLAWLTGTLDAAFDVRGSAHLNGLRIDTMPTPARRVGQVFQDPLLFAHMTVEENLLFAVPAGREADRRASVAQALADIELTAHARANPATLSGGQQSRVALVRALLAEPRALLLDEPFAKLDAHLRARMREWVFAQLRERGLCALLVTHDETDVADTRRVTRLFASTFTRP